jgi:hypothetical protein
VRRITEAAEEVIWEQEEVVDLIPAGGEMEVDEESDYSEG